MAEKSTHNDAIAAYEVSTREDQIELLLLLLH